MGATDLTLAVENVSPGSGVAGTVNEGRGRGDVSRSRVGRKRNQGLPEAGNSKEDIRSLWDRSFGPNSTPALRDALRHTLPPPPRPEDVQPAIAEVLRTPLKDIGRLYKALPFSFYLPADDGHFTIIIEAAKLDIRFLKSVPAQDVVNYIRYMGCLYYGNLDGRRGAKVKVVMDCQGLGMSEFLWGGGLGAVRAILIGLADLVTLLGDRVTDVVLVNASRVIKTLVSQSQKLVKIPVTIVALGERSEYGPYLQRLIGTKSVPKHLGGESNVPVDKAPMGVAAAELIAAIIHSHQPKKFKNMRSKV